MMATPNPADWELGIGDRASVDWKPQWVKTRNKASEYEKTTPEESDSPDSPTSPSYYTQGGIESIDYVKAQGWLPGFACGNILKYITRYPHKNGVEDLYKARVYLNWLIEHEENPDATQEDSNASVG